MNKAIHFIGFAAAISTILFLIHLYVFSRLAFLLSLKKNIYFYLVILLLVLSFAFATILERKYPNAVTRVSYVFSATWLGFLFMLLCCTVVWEIVRLFHNVPRVVAGLAILGAAAVLTVYAVINASSFRVSEVVIPMNLNEEIKLVQISDAHLGTIRNSRYLRKLVERTNALAPDFVAITGDLFDGTAPLRLETIHALDTVRAPVFLVTGNHEYYEGIENVLELLRKTNVKVLRNQVERFKGMQIIGVDYSGEKGFLEKTLSALEPNESEPTLLLYHVPVKAEALHKLGINAQLSGHTHKGQIFPYMLIDRLAYAYLSGLHGYKDSWVYVSAGSGTWGPPMRLGTKSEIGLIRLRKSTGDSSTKIK